MKPLDVLALPLQGTQVVEASAGTGKTWNICVLVLRALLERGLGVEQILVVTFSNAAAAELRERIRSRLAQAWRLATSADHDAEAGDPFLSALLEQAARASGETRERLALRLRDAVDRFDEASIGTLHGWAQRTLASSPLASGQPLAQELLADERELRRELLAEAWRREVLAAALPQPLLRHLAGWPLGPASFEPLLKRLRSRPLARVHWPADTAPGAWVAALGATASQHAALANQWPRWRPEVVVVLQHAAAALSGVSHKPVQIERSLAAWDTALAADTVSPGATSSELARLSASGLRVKTGHALPVHPFFDAAQAWINARIEAEQALQREMQALVHRILADAPQRLRERMAQQRVQSFDSLLESLHRALIGPGGEALARLLRQRHAVALIDEFQDTDSLQWALFVRLFGASAEPDRAGADAAPLLALVGDPKQAIYAFRSAELATYLAARNSVPEAQRHSLVANQRSVQPLLTALNALFGANERPFFEPGLEHAPVSLGAKPRHGLIEAAEAPPRAALQLWRLPSGTDGRPLPAVLAREAAAVGTAAEVARLLGESATGRALHAGRPLRAGDIAVLVRSHAQARQIQQALAARGVGAALRSHESVFASAEAEALECLMAALLAPADLAALKRLLALDAMGGTASAVHALASDDTGLAAWLAQLAAWRRTWWQHGPAALIRHWLADAGIVQRLLPRADGERRLTNLRHLAELLQHAAQGTAASAPGQAAAAGGTPGTASPVGPAAAATTPEAQWRWLLARCRDGQLDETRQLRLASDRQLVQVMTIHQSKGLEFPVVFLPFAWHPDPAPRPTRKALELPIETRDADGGTTLDFAPDATARQAAQALARQAAMGELQRLNYVAMTRAVARCHMVIGGFRANARRRALDARCRGSAQNWLVASQLGVPTAGDADVQRWIDGEAWGTAKPKTGDNTAAARDADALDAAWSRRVAEVADPLALRLDDLPGARDWGTARLAPDAPTAGRLEIAAAPLRPPRRSWQLTSYSGLALGAVQRESSALEEDTSAVAAAMETAAAASLPSVADHDLAASTDADSDTEASENLDGDPHTADAAVTDDDILHFPRGASAGSCLHRAFELAAFDDPAQWPTAAARAVAEVPPAAQAPSHPGSDSTPVPGRAPAQLQRMLTHVLADVLATPLTAHGSGPGNAPTLRLAGIPASRRLAELEFHLPLGRLDAGELDTLLAAHGLAGPRWQFATMAGGALRGFIDAVVEHGGRYWVLDWKSNHLGERPADYAAPRLAQAMVRGGYHLQAQLYLLALHRHLQRRLPGYSMQQHLGGALYLFVRGVRPHWPAGSGVHLSAPNEALLERLGRMFEATEAVA